MSYTPLPEDLFETSVLPFFKLEDASGIEIFKRSLERLTFTISRTRKWFDGLNQRVCGKHIAASLAQITIALSQVSYLKVTPLINSSWIPTFMKQ